MSGRSLQLSVCAGDRLRGGSQRHDGCCNSFALAEAVSFLETGGGLPLRLGVGACAVDHLMNCGYDGIWPIKLYVMCRVVKDLMGALARPSRFVVL